jgi:mutator protein MutT
MNQAVCGLVINPDGKILVVSRKDNHQDFGLPGGKIEEGEHNIQALFRELKEETGLSPMSFMLLHEGEDDQGYRVYTYLIHTYSGSIGSNEEGIIKWTTWEKLTTLGSFKDYNKKVHEKWIMYQKENQLSS